MIHFLTNTLRMKQIILLPLKGGIKNNQKLFINHSKNSVQSFVVPVQGMENTTILMSFDIILN